jgi:hypothetical protein
MVIGGAGGAGMNGGAGIGTAIWKYSTLCFCLIFFTFFTGRFSLPAKTSFLLLVQSLQQSHDGAWLHAAQPVQLLHFAWAA